jgi:hypothetical protein
MRVRRRQQLPNPWILWFIGVRLSSSRAHAADMVLEAKMLIYVTKKTNKQNKQSYFWRSAHDAHVQTHTGTAELVGGGPGGRDRRGQHRGEAGTPKTDTACYPGVQKIQHMGMCRTRVIRCDDSCVAFPKSKFIRQCDSSPELRLSLALGTVACVSLRPTLCQVRHFVSRCLCPEFRPAISARYLFLEQIQRGMPRAKPGS